MTALKPGKLYNITGKRRIIHYREEDCYNYIINGCLYVREEELNCEVTENTGKWNVFFHPNPIQRLRFQPHSLISQDSNILTVREFVERDLMTDNTTGKYNFENPEIISFLKESRKLAENLQEPREKSRFLRALDTLLGKP
ncbi:MAG: hypothetical protein ABIH72_05900 [archaeon]